MSSKSGCLYVGLDIHSKIVAYCVKRVDRALEEMHEKNMPIQILYAPRKPRRAVIVEGLVGVS